MTHSVQTDTLTNVNDKTTPWEHRGGSFNIRVSGSFTGTVEIQRAFSLGSILPRDEDYEPVTNDLNGTVVEITTPLNGPAYDPEEGVWYRAELTSLSAGGPITVRFSA